MKELPILFSEPMVKSIRAGIKTQTRRVILPIPDIEFGRYIWPVKNGCAWAETIKRPKSPIMCGAAKYHVGDILWVREAFAVDACGLYHFIRSDWIGLKPELKWRPGIFMPRQMARTRLEVTGVRVERLQDISEEDAKAEGIEGRWHPDDPTLWTWKDYATSSLATEPRFHYGSMVTPVSTYEGLWGSINGKKHPWASNPWVWVIKFRRL